jgi:hypothetical protein
MAESRAPMNRPVSKWKVRIFSDSILQALGERETMSVKPIIQDTEDIFHPNKHNILFRYTSCNLDLC